MSNKRMLKPNKGLYFVPNSRYEMQPEIGMKACMKSSVCVGSVRPPAINIIMLCSP